MSTFTNILTGRVKVTRRTDFVLDQIDVVDTLSPTRQPAESAKLEINIVGSSISSGIVSITGSTFEQISFSDNDSILTTLDFSSVSSITLLNIEDGTISIKAVDNVGAPITQEFVVNSNLPSRVYPAPKDVRLQMMMMTKAGNDQAGLYRMMLAPDTQINENDFVYVLSGIDGLTLGQVEEEHVIYEFDNAGATHHIEYDLKEI